MKVAPPNVGVRPVQQSDLPSVAAYQQVAPPNVGVGPVQQSGMPSVAAHQQVALEAAAYLSLQARSEFEALLAGSAAAPFPFPHKAFGGRAPASSTAGLGFLPSRAAAAYQQDIDFLKHLSHTLSMAVMRV